MIVRTRQMNYLMFLKWEAVRHMKLLRNIVVGGVLTLLFGCTTTPCPIPDREHNGGELYPDVGPAGRALVWLANQQNRDGSWGGRAEHRPELTGLVLVAFMSLGEGSESIVYGDRVIRAFERAVEYAKAERLDANSRSALLYALVLGWDLTLNPVLRDAALGLLARHDSGYSAVCYARALRTFQIRGHKNEGSERLKQCGIAFEGETGLYCQVGHAYCLMYANDRLWPDKLDALGTSDTPDWRQACRPVLTASMLYDLLYYRGSKKTDLWRRRIVEDVISRQYIKKDRSEGWWTATGLGVPDDPDAKRFSGDDGDLFVTAVVEPLLWSVRILPVTSLGAAEFQKGDMDPDDIRVDVGDL